MKRSSEYLQQRLETCRKLFFQYKGREHARIEREMRANGFPDFNRRSLYPRGVNPGWIERYGWDKELLSKLPAAANDTEPINEFHEWIRRVSPPNFDWDAPHLKYIIEKLQLVTEGKIKRLMIFMPPRHGKSELVTTRYTAWRLMKNPALKVILASYAQRLANRFSRGIRNTLAEHFALDRQKTEKGTKEIAETTKERVKRSRTNDNATEDDNTPISNPFRAGIINSAEEWETGFGGGVKAVGVGGGITGYGAGLMVIDDPIKSREQAESRSYRDKVWHWFNDDMMTRLEPDAPVILIQTRWHEDDLAGRLLKQQREEGTDEWHVISLPAIAKAAPSTGNGKRKAEGGTSSTSQTSKTSQTLIPARHLAFSTLPPSRAGIPYGDILREREEAKEALERAEAETLSPGSPPYAAESTGTSSVPERGVAPAPVVLSHADPLNRKPGQALWPDRFDIEHLERTKRRMGTYAFESLYQQEPVPTEGGMFKRSWFTNNIVPTAPPNLNWKRGYDLSFTANPDSDPSATLKVAYDKDGTVYIDGCFRGKLTYPLQRKMLMHYIRNETRTEHGIELSANGHGILQDLRRMPELRGKKFRGVKVDTDKLTRALPWIALAEEGRVRLVKGPWNEDFIQEACSFPHGQHDDQIDAVSVAVAMHGSGSRNGFWRF